MKKIFFNFLKDNLINTIGFFVSDFLILIYYYVSACITDILYPLLISSTIFIIIQVILWIKYYHFHSNSHHLEKIRNHKILEMTNEQKRFTELMMELQEKYLKEISKKNSENRSFRFFFSQWVHNMKTPVSILSLIIQKFESEVMCGLGKGHEEKIYDFIRAVRDENLKLKNGLEHLLNVLRMDEFVKDYEPETVDLFILLKEIINSKKSLFIYNNVFPKIECSYDYINVLTDAKWNGIMIEQIINNAVKYSSVKGKGKIIKFAISIIGDAVQLKIIDEGIGISKNDLNRVFEPFFTGENGRKFKDASGIGLYVCSLIAKNLNHKLEIESEVGVGSTVIITYPLKT